MKERKDHYETTDCDNCIFQGRVCAMFRQAEKCDEFVSYTTKREIKNELFDKCLAEVNPEVRAEVRRNMDRANARDEEIKRAAEETLRKEGYFPAVHEFMNGARWADENPSDATIMRILNCIGYEEESWIGFVRKELKKRGLENQKD